MKRILYTAPSTAHLIRYHLPLLHRMVDMGYEVCLAVGEGDLTSELEFASSFVVNSGLGEVSSPTSLNEMSSYLETGKFDVISSVGSGYSNAAVFTCMALKTSGCTPELNVVMNFGFNFDGDTNVFKRKIRMQREKSCRKVTDLLMVMNSSDRRYAEAARLARVVEQIPGTGVDIAALAMPTPQKRQAARAKLGCGDDETVIVYTGRFDKNHHQKFLVDCMFYLHRNIKLFMMGEGKYLQPCREKAFKLGLDGNVIMPGEVEDVLEYVSAADITLSATRYEGMPRFIIEGQAMGIPAVVSAVKGNMDIVTNGHNGMVYSLDDKRGFIQAMHQIVYDDNLRARLGRNAAREAAKYDSSLALNSIARCYEKALSGTSSHISVL